ncbi:hypothetical protein EGJ57_01205 [Brucella anthropi]|nr:hypothetical protein CQ057_08555 [Ochrobactrum sp. MYb49]RRY21463.1 hypothetical protein EGJ57_01205 [Brucella anthropi]
MQMSCQSRQWASIASAQKSQPQRWLRLARNRNEKRSISSWYGAPCSCPPDASPHSRSCAFRHYDQGS